MNRSAGKLKVEWHVMHGKGYHGVCGVDSPWGMSSSTDTYRGLYILSRGAAVHNVVSVSNSPHPPLAIDIILTCFQPGLTLKTLPYRSSRETSRPHTHHRLIRIATRLPKPNVASRVSKCWTYRDDARGDAGDDTRDEVLRTVTG